MAGGDGSPTPFRRERAYGGLGLIALVVVLAIIDAFRSDYSLDPIVLAIILGSGIVLLGVEAGKYLIGGR